MMIASAAGESSRRAEALARAGCEEGSRRARHGRRERRCGEDAEAGQEHPPTPEQVGGAAAEEEQASEDERVAGDRPADVGAAELKVFREARQRDVHGRDVEDDHQLGDEQDEQEDAAALAGGRRTGSIVAPTGRRRVAVAASVMLGRGSLQD